MYRILRIASFRFGSESLYALKSSQHGGSFVTRKLKHFGTTSSLMSNDFTTLWIEPAKKSAQMRIVTALRLGERSRASALLWEFVHGNYSLIADDFLDILKLCAKSPDPVFAMETWRIMLEKGIHFNGTSLLTIVKALCRGGYLDEAFHLIDFVRDNDRISPVLPLYNCLLGASARLQSMVHANRCLDLMERHMVGKSEITYSELLKLAVWQRNHSAVQEIWKDYIKHYSVGLLSLRKFIWSFTRLGDLNSAYSILQDMVALAVTGHLFIKSGGEGRIHSTRLDIPVPSTCEISSMQNPSLKEDTLTVPLMMDPHNLAKEHCVACLENQKVETFSVDLIKKKKNIPASKLLRWSFSDVIHACAQAQNCELAEHLVIQMENLGIEPSSHTYDGFVRAVVSEKGLGTAIAVLERMQQLKLKPYDSTLATLSANCSKHFQLDLAEILLGQISKCSHLYPYNSLLAACDTMDQPERAIRVLAKMKQQKLQPDIRTYELLFSLFGNVNAPYEEGNMLSQIDSAKRIHTIEMDMAKRGVQHNQFSMGNLLKALGAEGMVQEMMQYLHKAESLFSLTNTHIGTAIYNTVLHSLVETGESNMAIEIFQSMRSCGFPLDAATYNIMIDCCSIIRSFRSACSLVSLMIRDGFCPETVTYTAFIKILLEEENFDEALNVLDQAKLEEIQLDVLCYNTVLQKAFYKGRVDIVEYIIERMKREGIQPDPSTCQYVFCAYVERGFLNTAMEALQVLSLRMLGGEDASSLEENMTGYKESCILAEDTEAESRIMKLFKESNDHHANALLNLRWCAILGYPMSWSVDQSPWARRLANSYASRE